jgi:hypothetical protein
MVKFNLFRLRLSYFSSKLSGENQFFKFNTKFCQELIAYFSLTRYGHHIKRRIEQCFYCCRRGQKSRTTVLARASSNSLDLELLFFTCIFVAVGTCVRTCWLATIGWIYIHAHRQQYDLINLLLCLFIQNREISLKKLRKIERNLKLSHPREFGITKEILTSLEYSSRICLTLEKLADAIVLNHAVSLIWVSQAVQPRKRINLYC